MKRQLKVNESIEEYKKVSSSLSIEKSTKRIPHHNEKGLAINDLNNSIGSPHVRSFSSLNTPLVNNTPKSSYAGTPFPFINQINQGSNLSKMNSPGIR